jgi:hypothetical protein
VEDVDAVAGDVAGHARVLRGVAGSDRGGDERGELRGGDGDDAARGFGSGDLGEDRLEADDADVAQSARVLARARELRAERLDDLRARRIRRAAEERGEATHRERGDVPGLVVQLFQDRVAHLTLHAGGGAEGVLGELGEKVRGGHVAKICAEGGEGGGEERVSAEARARERRVRGRRRVREERATTKNAREEDETSEINAREIARTRRGDDEREGGATPRRGGRDATHPCHLRRSFSRIAERADDPDAIATGDSIRRDLNCEALGARTTCRKAGARATRRADSSLVSTST